MRMMLRWTVPVESGNAAIRDGTMTSALESLVDDLKPESAYFWSEMGERAGMLIFDMSDSSDIPVIAERLFMGLDASVEFVPVMNLDDLKRALSKVGG